MFNSILFNIYVMLFDVYITLSLPPGAAVCGARDVQGSGRGGDQSARGRHAVIRFVTIALRMSVLGEAEPPPNQPNVVGLV